MMCLTTFLFFYSYISLPDRTALVCSDCVLFYLVFILFGVTSWKHVWILCQCGSNFLLFLKPPRVRHLDMASFGGCGFIYYSLQSSVQLRAVLCESSGSAGGPCALLASGSVGNDLRWDFIQNLWLGLLPPKESHLPPDWRRLRHDGWTLGWMESWAERKQRW